MSDGRAYDWDEKPIEKPAEGGDGEYVLLTPGTYPFRVTKFERGIHTMKPGGKMPDCKKAILVLEVDGGDQGEASIKVDLYLHTMNEKKLCAFFKSIGDRKSGEALKMDWNNIFGKRGWCKVKNRPGEGQYLGKTFNEIDWFVDAPTETPESALPAPSWDPASFADPAPAATIPWGS